MRGSIVGAGLAVSLVFAPAAPAANDGGAGYTYNSGTGSVGLNVKNSPDSGSPLTGIDFTLPDGTTLDGTPSGGASCTAMPPRQGSCQLNPAAQPGKNGFVFINTDGAKPGSIEVVLDYQDGSSVPVVATECTAVTVSPDSLPVGTGRAPYSVLFEGAGGAGEPYTFALQGVLPEGLELDDVTGLLSGTPTTVGTFTFTILAFDENGCQGSRSYTLTVQPESAGPPQLADVAVESIAPGIYFATEDEGEIGFFGAPSLYFVPVALPEGSTSAGFHPFSTWFAGDRADIQVDVTNKGPSAATFDLNVEPVTAGGLEYRGHYQFVLAPNAQNSRLEFKPGLPSVLGPGATVYLIFSTPLPRAGPVTLGAALTAVSPTDPNLANNKATNTFTVLGRTTHRDVSWQPDGAGGDITGTSSPASGSAIGAASAAAARPRPVEIAVLRRRGARCTWLTGKAGRLQRKPRASRCLKPVFLRAKGTRRWRYHLNKRPPKGRYTVLVRRRPLSPAQAEQQFARSLRNLFRIRIP